MLVGQDVVERCDVNGCQNDVNGRQMAALGREEPVGYDVVISCDVLVGGEVTVICDVVFGYETIGCEELVGYDLGGCEMAVGYDVTVRSDVALL